MNPEYRVVKHPTGEVAVAYVFFNEDGEPTDWTDELGLGGPDVAAVVTQLTEIELAINKPHLSVDSIGRLTA